MHIIVIMALITYTGNFFSKYINKLFVKENKLINKTCLLSILASAYVMFVVCLIHYFSLGINDIETIIFTMSIPNFIMAFVVACPFSLIMFIREER